MKPSKQEIRQEAEKVIRQKKKEKIAENVLENLVSKEERAEHNVPDDNRRKFLRIGVLGVGTLALSSLASAQFTNAGTIYSSVPSFSDVLSQDNNAGAYNIDLDGNDLKDSTTPIWDKSNSFVPSGRIQTTFGSTLSFNAPLALDASGGDRLALPGVSSDPSANAGDIWYRPDIDPAWINLSFEGKTYDENGYTRPFGWRYGDSTTGDSDVGSLHVLNDNSATDGDYVMHTGWTGNDTTLGEMFLEQEVDMTGVDTISVDLIDVNGAQRSELQIRIDGSTEASKVFPSSGSTTVSATGLNYTGVRTLKLAIVHVAADNFGSNNFDNVRYNSLYIDDYEDNDLSEYTVYAEGSGTWSTTSSVVKDGSYAVNGQNDGGNTVSQLVSLSGLDRYPSAGDKFEVWIRKAQTDSQLEAYFAVQDAPPGGRTPPNCYAAGFTNSNQGVRIYNYNSGSNIATGSLSRNVGGEWIKMTVDWESDGTMTAEFKDTSDNVLETISGSDTTYSSGGWGFKAYDNDSTANFYIDSARII